MQAFRAASRVQAWGSQRALRILFELAIWGIFRNLPLFGRRGGPEPFMQKPCSCHPEPPQPERRSFLKQAAAGVLGTLAALLPAIPGVGLLLDPLRRASGHGGFIRVARLDDLPENGTPRLFPVVATKTDVWNRIPEAKIGAVYLRRQEARIVAFHVSCPHAGCPVEYRSDLPPVPEPLQSSAAPGFFYCPCHNSSFGLDGTIRDQKSPAKRPLDTLEVEVRGQEIFVRFQNYIADREDKIPVA
jgi:menaquinol-cytochrome c reductase iron-sulfur subunit